VEPLPAEPRAGSTLELAAPLGQLKDMAARSLLLKLQERGCIQLPPRRWASPNRMRHKRMPAWAAVNPSEPIIEALSELLPLWITGVSAPARRLQRPLFEWLAAYLR